MHCKIYLQGDVNLTRHCSLLLHLHRSLSLRTKAITKRSHDTGERERERKKNAAPTVPFYFSTSSNLIFTFISLSLYFQTLSLIPDQMIHFTGFVSVDVCLTGTLFPLSALPPPLLLFLFLSRESPVQRTLHHPQQL